MENLTVHCLICDNTYSEYDVIIEICPHCGNDNKLETVYLVDEIDE